VNIILTGASGFIGSALLKELAFQKHNVVAMGRKFLSKQCDSNVLYYEENLLHLNMDRIMEYVSRHGLDNIDVIIHAAGQAHIVQSEANKKLFVENNIEVTRKALNLAVELKVSKFIFLSSVAVMCGNDQDDIYSYTKKKAEKLVVDACEQSMMSYTIVRPVAVYGELDFKGNMYKLMKQVNKGILPVVKKGNIVKNLIYVQNLSAIISSVLQTSEWANQVIIARDKERLTTKQICELIDAETKKHCMLVPIPVWVLHVIMAIIGFGQLIGFFREFNLQSIKRLSEAVDITLSEENQKVVNALPYSSMEGLQRTVRWFLAET
jgi:nucleoside-diphosphate-sugar epimerase